MTNKDHQQIFIEKLYIGKITNITYSKVECVIDYNPSNKTTTHFGNQYMSGSVGEYIVIEHEYLAILGQIYAINLEEREKNYDDSQALKPRVSIQLLATYYWLEDKLQAGIKESPRISEKIYSAPNWFLNKLTNLINDKNENGKITLGKLSKGVDGMVEFPWQALFERHCAILGATGGGKSYSVAKIIEELIKLNDAEAPNILLLDATGEYQKFKRKNKYILGEDCFLNYANFNDNDFMALFSPAPNIQTPIFIEAIKSLKAVAFAKRQSVNPLQEYIKDSGDNSLLFKRNKNKQFYINFLKEIESSEYVNNPNSQYDVNKLPDQIQLECIFDSNRNDNDKDNFKFWGDINNNSLVFCTTLILRIRSFLMAEYTKKIFQSNDDNNIFNLLKKDKGKINKLTHISLKEVSYEFQMREIIVNCIARKLLTMAREGKFQQKPLIIFIDEAHNFIGKKAGGGENRFPLDAIEIIAKEGRKYGLHLCLATQRPADLPDGIISQMGCMLVHRLTNGADREKIERASNDIDRETARNLPSLIAGEAIIAGVGFPFPMTIQMDKPKNCPEFKANS